MSFSSYRTVLWLPFVVVYFLSLVTWILHPRRLQEFLESFRIGDKDIGRVQKVSSQPFRGCLTNLQQRLSKVCIVWQTNIEWNKLFGIILLVGFFSWWITIQWMSQSQKGTQICSKLYLASHIDVDRLRNVIEKNLHVVEKTEFRT